ncbi:MAG TPA: SDR family oxidoreductase, partial [Desulfobacterales bacterium]|nr:SDR family oxidoreductase [Desulfobacterales bacterium]
MDLNLQNRVVLITGSSRGIGKGIAEVFLREGARVVLTGRSETRLDKTVSGFFEQFGEKQIFRFPGDLNQMPVLEKLKTFIKQEVKALDHLVCNIGSGRSVPPLQEDRHEFQRMLDINLI